MPDDRVVGGTASRKTASRKRQQGMSGESQPGLPAGGRAR